MEEYKIKQFKARLEGIIQKLEGKNWYDQESAHIDADDVLCDMLNDVGLEDIVKLYNSIPKWYA